MPSTLKNHAKKFLNFFILFYFYLKKVILVYFYFLEHFASSFCYFSRFIGLL